MSKRGRVQTIFQFFHRTSANINLSINSPTLTQFPARWVTFALNKILFSFNPSFRYNSTRLPVSCGASHYCYKAVVLFICWPAHEFRVSFFSYHRVILKISVGLPRIRLILDV
jgi:hypothetical protein